MDVLDLWQDCDHNVYARSEDGIAEDVERVHKNWSSCQRQMWR